MADLESRGLVAVMVASGAFVTATQAQADALGFDPAAVYVPHPIQDRTDAEMIAMAEAAEANVIAALTSLQDKK